MIKLEIRKTKKWFPMTIINNTTFRMHYHHCVIGQRFNVVIVILFVPKKILRHEALIPALHFSTCLTYCARAISVKVVCLCVLADNNELFRISYRFIFEWFSRPDSATPPIHGQACTAKRLWRIHLHAYVLNFIFSRRFVEWFRIYN